MLNENYQTGGRKITVGQMLDTEEDLKPACATHTYISTSHLHTHRLTAKASSLRSTLINPTLTV